MQYAHTARVWRIGLMAATALLALAWLASAAAQPQPPLRLYGSGTAGDMIRVSNETGDELGVTRVATSGDWHIDVDCHTDRMDMLDFSLNGTSVNVRVSVTGADQARVAILGPSSSAIDSDSDPAADGDPAEDEQLMADDLLSEDDELADNDLMEDLLSDDAALDDGATDGAGTAYPDSGTGGLLDQGSSTTQIALWIAAVMAGAATLGIAVHRHRRA